MVKDALHKGEKLRDRIDAELAAVRADPRLVRSFFQAPSVAYIRDCWVIRPRIGHRKRSA